ncbi:hypothetical protein Mpsy_2669 [Methanolobus psychrophilus R15]|nr:hypothetical protein Mpsy_2669 [Methanolobus psychrophilus R15]
MNVSCSITLPAEAEAFIGDSSAWNEYKGTTSERRTGNSVHAESTSEKLTDQTGWNNINWNKVETHDNMLQVRITEAAIIFDA